jgi:hypothetical protein
MAYQGDLSAKCYGRDFNKFDYARHMASMLGYLLIGQQDAAGLVTFDTQIRKYIPARARTSQVRTILETLEQTEPGGETGLADIFHDIAERIPRRGLVIIFSDLYDDPEALINALHHFRYRRHEVVLFHIVADEEINFSGQFLSCDDLRLWIAIVEFHSEDKSGNNSLDVGFLCGPVLLVGRYFFLEEAEYNFFRRVENRSMDAADVVFNGFGMLAVVSGEEGFCTRGGRLVYLRYRGASPG